MQGLKISIFLIAVFVFLHSCKKPETYPIEPFIEWQSFTEVDTVSNGISKYQLIFKLTDGDGDIGFNDQEHPSSGNIFLSFYEMENDSFVLSDLYNSYKARMPFVQPNGATKGIKADVFMDIDLITMAMKDTFRFELYVVDRASHKSNTLVSPTYVLER